MDLVMQKTWRRQIGSIHGKQRIRRTLFPWFESVLLFRDRRSRRKEELEVELFDPQLQHTHTVKEEEERERETEREREN